MKEIIDKLKLTKEFITLLVFFAGGFIGIYIYLSDYDKKIENIQKTTLRTMIWSSDVPKHDRLEACDTYVNLGFNSETKKYCEEILNK